MGNSMGNLESKYRDYKEDKDANAQGFLIDACTGFFGNQEVDLNQSYSHYSDEESQYTKDEESTLDSGYKYSSRKSKSYKKQYEEDDSTYDDSLVNGSIKKHGKDDYSVGSSTLVSDVVPSGNMKPLASSFAKRCHFTKAGIGKTTPHYEGLTLTGQVVLMLANAMKLKGCPTICDEDLRRVEQTYPNQFSRLPDELLLSSGWRRISKYCHFSNKAIPDGVPFFHSRERSKNGSYYFLLAGAVGMNRPSDVEPLTRDTLVLLETDFPSQCDQLPPNLLADPTQWILIDKFCFFSGGPIHEEDVYYKADLDGNSVYMLAFLSPSLGPEDLYRLNSGIGEQLRTVQAVNEVESVYNLTERDFDDLKLYHLGPCRALPSYVLKPEHWNKVLPREFLRCRAIALDRARGLERGPSGPPVANEQQQQVPSGNQQFQSGYSQLPYPPTPSSIMSDQPNSYFGQNQPPPNGIHPPMNGEASNVMSSNVMSIPPSLDPRLHGTPTYNMQQQITPQMPQQNTLSIPEQNQIPDAEIGFGTTDAMNETPPDEPPMRLIPSSTKEQHRESSPTPIDEGRFYQSKNTSRTNSNNRLETMGQQQQQQLREDGHYPRDERNPTNTNYNSVGSLGMQRPSEGQHQHTSFNKSYGVSFEDNLEHVATASDVLSGTSVYSGSSVWTDTDPNNRSSRRAMILKMAKERMMNSRKVEEANAPSEAGNIDFSEDLD